MTAPVGPAGRWADLGEVGQLVDGRIGQLQRGYLADEPGSVATLARLRGAVGKPAGSVPAVWHATNADHLVPPSSPDAPTAAETAVHVALTLYAVHQQSVRREMHRRGWGLGRSVRTLRAPVTELDPVRRRFQALGTADSLGELLHHARGMVQLLRAGDVPLDHALLADQLHRWQRPDGPAHVRLQWARDYYRSEPDPTTTPTA